MQYNIKIIHYPDGSKIVKIYDRVIECGLVPDVKPIERDPFNNKRVTNVFDFDDHFDHVRDVSLKRTKKAVYDLARSNIWDYFVTFTFDKKKVDRYDYDAVCKKLKGWLDQLRRKSPDMYYIIVPERHKDGAWHMHGLFGCVSDKLVSWIGKYVIKRVRSDGRDKFLRTSQKIYKIDSYNLGWMTAIEIYDQGGVASYITKYITKDMVAGSHGRKRYFSSKGLFRPVEDVFLYDQYDRFRLEQELLQNCKYTKVCTFDYGDATQVVRVIEL